MTGRVDADDLAAALPDEHRAPPGLPYFLVDGVPPRGEFTLGGPEGRHAAQVRRLRVGEQLVLTDGNGGWARATVSGADRGELRLAVGESRQQDAPLLRVVLVQALPKGDHGERAVDLATEAGIDEIVPWTAARCVTRWPSDRAEKGVARWRSAAREAAKQARRPYVPLVRNPVGTDEVSQIIAAAAGAVVLHEAGPQPLPAIELPRRGDLVLVVGPEGGIAREELEAFAAVGARPVRLGPEVLRSSAAAAVALGALGVLTQRWAVPAVLAAQAAQAVLAGAADPGAAG